MNEKYVDPVFPCICGHSITAHDSMDETYRRWEWDDDHKEQVEANIPYSNPVCFECGPADCPFVEMTNLEYVEFKAHDKI